MEAYELKVSPLRISSHPIEGYILEGDKRTIGIAGGEGLSLEPPHNV